MPNIKQMYRYLKIALGVLGALCLASIVVLVSPIGRTSRHGEAQVQQLRTELLAKQREAASLPGIDKKLELAKDEITTFYKDRLPSSYASIFDQLGKVAADNGVKLTSGRYRTEPADLPDVQHVELQATVSGNYLQLVKFINAIERDKMFFLIDDVQLQGSQVGMVNLQIRMETYLKSLESQGSGGEQ